MGYHLGVDLGTTYTAAAVERDGRVQVVTLGNRMVSIPSVVFVTADGTFLVGEAAERRGATEPERFAREFKRRVGDPTPLILGGAPWAPEALMGKLLRWVVDRVTELEGGPPSAIALTHPANWGTYKLDLLEQAARHAGVSVVRFLTEPEAAATAYASHERVADGAIIAVYDLGGGTFDAAVLRKREDGFDILGQPEGIERLGGVDVDQAVFTHVLNSLGGAAQTLDQNDPAVVASFARLRRECVDAKEALSADTDVSVPVNLPGLATEVRLTRSELEYMVRPALGETVIALQRALRSAGVGPEHVWAVLLVGGSSRIPLVAQLVGGEIGRPIAVDANPKDTVALGAAVAAAQAVGAASPESVTPLPTAVPAEEAAPTQPVAPTEVAPAWATTPAPAAAPPAAAPPPAAQPQAKRPNRTGLVAALVAFVVLAAGAAFLILGGGGDDDDVADDDETTRTVEVEDSTTTLDDDVTTTTEDEIRITTAPPVAAYTPEVREEFVSECIAGPGAGAEDPEQLCNCYMDVFEDTVPFSDFEEFDRTGQIPQEVLDRLDPCDDAFA